MDSRECERSSNILKISACSGRVYSTAPSSIACRVDARHIVTEILLILGLSYDRMKIWSEAPSARRSSKHKMQSVQADSNAEELVQCFNW